MSFLSKTELKTVASLEIVDTITGADDSIVNAIINESISVMKSYLSLYYDAEAIFTVSGTARNLTVLKHLKAIVIYEVFIRLTRDMNEVAKARYDEAMMWLEKLNTGEFTDNSLPPLPGEETSPDQCARYGGNQKYNSSF